LILHKLAGIEQGFFKEDENKPKYALLLKNLQINKSDDLITFYYERMEGL
jgi:hypothetical protein